MIFGTKKLFADKGGFTLVELVVVISVIAILAGITVPVIMGVTDNTTEDYAKQQVHTTISNNIDFINDVPLPAGTLLVTDKDNNGTIDYGFSYTEDFEIESVVNIVNNSVPVADTVRTLVDGMVEDYEMAVLMSYDNCVTPDQPDPPATATLIARDITANQQFGLLKQAFNASSVTWGFPDPAVNPDKTYLQANLTVAGQADPLQIKVYFSQEIKTNCLAIVPLAKKAVDN